MFLFILNRKNIVFLACFLSTSIVTSKSHNCSFVYLGNEENRLRNAVQYVWLQKNKKSCLFNKFKKLLRHNTAIIPSTLIKAILLHIQYFLENNPDFLENNPGNVLFKTRTFTNIGEVKGLLSVNDCLIQNLSVVNFSVVDEVTSSSLTILPFNTASIVHNDSSGLLSSSLIVDADVSASAAIVDTKLATISTAGKVANSATTATSANTASTIIARDASGNFSAGTITANLTGTVTGSASLNVLKAGDTMTGNLQLSAGTAAAPSLLFTGSTATGLSAPSANTLSISTNGSQGMGISSAGIVTIDDLTPAGVVYNDVSGNLSTSLIVNADVSASAAIPDTKLATISTAGKISNSATTATSTNTASTIVARDASGNLSGGSITADLAGTVTGSASLNVLKAGDTMTGNLQLSAGTAAAPSLLFTGSTATGLSAPSANTLSISTNGSQRIGISSAGVVTINGLASAGVVHTDASGNLSTSLIVNADVSASAAIADTKLATISTAGKVSTSATTATSANTASAIVARTATGGFSAGIISVTDTVASGNLIFTTNPSTSTAGNIMKGANSYIHNTGSANMFAGESAGNFTTTGAGNSGFGVGAIQSNTTGFNNVAIGNLAMQMNTTGQSNVAVGVAALRLNTGGGGNVACGVSALQQNTIGNFNTAIGSGTLLNNTTGANNTGCGYNALVGNTIGSDNTAVGYLALDSNTTGNQNTAIGSNALQSCTSGSRNTAIGYQALNLNSTGNDNVAIGTQASRDTTGSNNIAIGYLAGFATTGSNNIHINTFGSSGDSGTIRIGDAFLSRTLIFGIYGATTAGGTTMYVTTNALLGTSLSSERFKRDIQVIDNASEFIYQLRPVTFIYNADQTNTIQYGLIAEEVDKIFPHIVVRNAEGQAESVQYDVLPIFMLNEIHKQQNSIDELKRQGITIEKMNMMIAELDACIEQYISN